MRKLYALLFTVVLFSAVKVNAQITVTVTGATNTTPNLSATYASLSDAITGLNTVTAMTGPVVFDLAAGTTETSTTQYTITATGSATNSITFKKNGAGANPILSRTDAGTNTTSTVGGLGDGIIRIDGTDNIIFDGLDVIASNQGIEYGYYSHKPSATDACQGLTIKNCNITMTKGTSGFVFGIHISNGTTSVSSATGVTVTANSGRTENVTITGNTISNVHGGIYCRGFSSATFYDQNFTIGSVGAGNTINNFGGGSATTTYGIYFIYTNNVNVDYNMLDNAGNGGSAHASTFYGVFYSTVTGVVTGNNNSFTLANNSASSLSYCLYQANSVTTQTFNNNTFGATVSSTGTMYLMYISNSSAGITTISGNSVPVAINRTSASGSFYCYYDNGSPTGTLNFYNNNFSNITLAGSSSFYGVNSTTALAHTQNIYNNTFSNITGGTGLMYGIYTNTAGSRNIYGNIINNFSGGGTIYGIYTTSGGNTANNFYKNKIYGLSSGTTSTTAGIVSGLLITTVGTNTNIYNNVISDLTAPSSASIDAVRGLSFTSATASANLNVYYNTIHLNASSGGANFGSSGIYATANATATTAKLDLRNNIIVNNSTNNGTGFTVVYRRSTGTAGTLANYASTSNNNNFYSNSGGYIYYDGTSNALTVNDYQIGAFTAGTIAPRDAVSITEDPEFQSTDGTNANFLKYKVTSSKGIESGGANIATFTNDYAGTIRQGNAGYTGTGTAPDIGAWELEGIPSYTCTPPNPGNTVASANPICLGNSVTLSLTNPPSGTGNTYQWQSSADNVSYTNISGATNPTYTTTPTTSLYYKNIVTCQAGPTTATSNAVQVTFTNNVLSTTDSSRCGTGTVVLKATGNPGSTLRWYNAATGGSSIGTGSPFTTPTIANTTTYYVAAEGSSIADVQIGTGGTTSATYSNPFYSLWSNIHTQHIVRASELLAAGLGAGNLNSVSLNVTVAGTLPMIDLSVKIGTTTDTSAATFKNNAGFSEVFTSSSYMPTVGANVLTFTSPFYWDGSSNIILEFCHGNSGSSATMSRTIVADNTSYISSIKTHISAATAAATICPDVTSQILTYSVRPTFTFNGDAICSSPRKAVTATVTPAPVLTITGDTTICNNSIQQLSVTSNTADFNTYQWTPATNLYTDAAATVAYVGGSSATTVYVKSSTAGTVNYVSTANNTTSLCSNTDTSKVTILPASPTVAATTNKQQCLSGTATFGLTPSTGYGAATIQWQSSLNNSSFSDVSGANTVTYTTPTLTTTTYYRVLVKIGSTTCTTSDADTIIVNSPSVLNKVDSFRCGTGTVTLQATGSAGTTLKWYTTASGGTSIATGSPFVTPTISSTTPYYVSASQGGGSGTVGPLSPSIGTGASSTIAIGTQQLFFNVEASSMTLSSVTVYPTATIGSSFTIVIQNSALAEIYNSGPILTTVTGGTNPQVVTLNAVIPNGTGYRMGFSTNPGMIRNSTGAVYPYSIPGTVSITGNSFDPVYYYFFYNWNVSTGCESARTLVTATINTPPSITATASVDTICNGSSSNLNVTSSNAGYKYVWTPGSLNGAAQTVSPSANTTYTVTATDTTTSGPTSTCVAVATKTITVNPTPSALSVSPSSPAVCSTGPAIQLTASGGLVSLSNSTIFTENFNGVTNSWTTINNSTGGTGGPALAAWTLQPNAYSYSAVTYNSNDNSQFYFSNSDAQGSGGTTATELKSPAFSTVNYTTASIKFYHYYRDISGSTGKVEVSTDGSTWTTLQTYSTLQGAPAAFVLGTVTLTAPFLNQPTVYLRFKYDGAYSWYWAIDNVSVVGDALVPGVITWSPNTGLYKNAGATIAYTGGDSTVVFAMPSTSSTYTVTATNSFNCTSSNTVTVNIAPNTTIAYVSGGNIQTVDLGRPINLIKYKVTNATGSSSVGLPAGVTAVLTADTIRISGTPTATGVYNYKIIGTGLCRPDTLSGTITVDSCTIDWGNVQWPPSGTINNCGNYSVYAQVYKSGYTEAPGAAVGMQAWIGISTTNSNPATWPESNWKLATFNVQVGNNDEFTYNFSNLDTGNYFIASRYKLPCSNLYYGGYNSGGGGAWNGTTNTSVTLRVNAIPAPVSGGNQSQCAQSPIQTLTATATGSNVTWWTAASGGTKVTSPTLNSVGTITYYAQDSTSGCNSLARTAVSLTIKPLPTISSLTGSGTICKGDSLQYTINFTGTAPWIFVVTHSGGGANDTITTSSNPFTVWDNSQATQTHTIIKLTDSTGCVNSGTLASGTTTVTVVNPPTSGGNQTQCEQSPLQTLTASATGSNVTWYTAASGGTLVTSPTLNSIGTITYYAQDSANGCKSLTRTAVTLTINAAPSAVAVTPNSATQCTNSPAQKLTATGGVGAGTYVWTPTSGLFTDAAATTAYTGGGIDSVFAQPGSTTKYTATSTNTNNCSSMDTSNIIVNCTLPVSYLNFAGVKEAGNNVLRWTTSTEQNNKGFDVERSIDGRTFSSIGYVVSKGDNGNSNQELSYSFIDNQLTSSIYYYRLRQIDLNGKTSYSNTVVIKGDRVNTIKVSGLYPNPATEEVRITIDAPNADRVVLVVTDIYGKQLMQEQVSVEVGSNNTRLNVGRLAAGTYIVKLVSTKTNESSTIKFIKL